MNLDQLKQSLLHRGPHRVVVDPDGYAVHPVKAEAIHRIKPVVVFIRGDGWTLGAPEQFRDVAENLWRDEWQYVFDVKRGDMKEYR